jgi:hypothetical protein
MLVSAGRLFPSNLAFIAGLYFFGFEDMQNGAAVGELWFRFFHWSGLPNKDSNREI